MDFVKDDFVIALANNKRPDVFGIIIAALFNPPLSFKEPYEKFVKELHQIEPESTYVYPFEALHCTVATLVSFRSTKIDLKTLDETKRHQLIDSWKIILQKAFQDDSFPRKPFEITISSPTISPAAGFFHFVNPSGEIERIRQCVQNAVAEGALKNFPSVPEDEISIPKIIHSSFLRFTEKPKIPNYEAKFKEIANQWNDVTVPVHEISLVLEDHPYMHIPKDSKHIIHTFKF